MLIRSGEARLVGWSRNSLYSGLNTLHRSVFWSADLNGRSDNTDVIRLEFMSNDQPLYFCGELDHSHLSVVVRLAGEVFSPDAVSIYKSGFDGSERLRIRSNAVRIDTQIGSNSLVSGEPGATIPEATQYLEEFANLLSNSKIRHRFELYNGDTELVVEFQYLPTNNKGVYRRLRNLFSKFSSRGDGAV